MKNILENEIDSRIEILKINFPECFDRDGNFNFQKFDEIINPSIKTFKDSYGINWLGKSYAKRLTSVPISTVLQEDLEHNSQEINKNSENIYIKGDNLEVLRHLSSAYSNKIKLIYIDPPYNTKNGEFVYNDNREFSEKELNIMVEEEIISEGERDRILEWTDKKSSSHSAWLTFMYPRLYLARKLLREDGAIFISIDDNENAQLKLLCDEIFGEENYVSDQPTIMNLKGNPDSYGVAECHENTYIYTKNKQKCILNKFEVEEDEIIKEWEEDEYGLYKRADTLKRSGQDASREKRPKGYFPVFINNKNEVYVTDNDTPLSSEDEIIYPLGEDDKELSWTWSKAKIIKEFYNLIVIDTKNGKNIYKKQRPELGELPTKKCKSFFYKPEYSTSTATTFLKKLMGNKIFDSPKPVPLIKDILVLGSDKNSIILDFFSGSATTAHAVMDLNADDAGNRKYIMVQLEEKLTEGTEGYKYCIDNNLPTNITSIGIERIKKSAEKIKKEKNADIDYGFKIYSIKDVPNKLILDDSFDPTVKTLFEKNLLTENEKNALLTTYKVFDGNLLSENIKSLFIGENEVYFIQDILYILNEIRSENFVKELLEKIDKDKEFIVNKIVIYGYESTDGKFRKELTENIKSYNNKKNATINVEVRY